MKKLILIGLLFAGILQAQIPVFNAGGNYRDGVVCDVKTFNAATDTSYTSDVIYWDDYYTLITGAVSLSGGFDLISGADTLCTINVRLVMRRSAATTGNSGTVIYDSTGYHTLTTGDGNYIPAENAVTSTFTLFSVDLAGEEWWKPCIGIEVQFIQCSMASGTKEVEAYLIVQRYSY